MGEDYTWDGGTATSAQAQLAQRVAELEGYLDAAHDRTAEAQRERDNLRRDRDAVMAANVSLNKRAHELEARLAELEPSGFALTNSGLIQRVHQLEAQLNAAIMGRQQLERQNAALMAIIEVGAKNIRAAEQERDELRAKLDAVPVKAIASFMDRVAFSEEGWPSGYEQERPIIDEWLDGARAVQP